MRCRRSLPYYGVVLLLTIPLCACTKEAPTSPGFRYAGEWTGFWKDTPAMFLRGIPDGSDITLKVAPDGSATVKGSRQQQYTEGYRSCKIEMTLTVTPDGSVYGTGRISSGLTNVFGYNAEGEVVGQLDARTGQGTGDLIAEIYDVVWHFPWRVERQ